MRSFAGASRMVPGECFALASHARGKGLDGVMIMSPYHFPHTHEVISRTPRR
jgi:4-hydroxy-tetrahydrodipicolinate synthase